MFHLIWYVLIGLLSGLIAKSVMHVHITLLWTMVLGIIGSILGRLNNGERVDPQEVERALGEHMA